MQLFRHDSPADEIPQSKESTAIGVFQDGEPAHRAVLALLEQGFTEHEIAAAYRGGPEMASSASRSDSPPAGERWLTHLRAIYHRDGGESSAPDHGGADFDRALTHLAIAPAEAARLSRTLGTRGAIVTVRAGARAGEAQAVLDHYRSIPPRAASVASSQTSEQHQSALVEHESITPPTAAEPNSQSTAPSPSQDENRSRRVQLLGEELRVHKDTVSSGDVRVRKETVTQMQTVQVPVTREQLVVERADSSGRVAPGSETRIPLSEEHVRVDKETVVREEYKVDKRDSTSAETVSGEVRRERLLIDEQDGSR